MKKVGFIFEKVLDFLYLLWCVVVLTGGATHEQPNKRIMARHHEDLEKSFTDEQKETFEKFHDCWSEYMSLAKAAIFEYAFKLGMQIAIETLTK